MAPHLVEWNAALRLLEHARYANRAGHGKRWVPQAMGEAVVFRIKWHLSATLNGTLRRTVNASTCDDWR